MAICPGSNPRPKLSVVIPALNEEKLLPECLHSLKEQDYTGSFEIIVVDNGSTDGTARIAREFGVKVLSSSEIKSAVYARQVGADAACGEIIVQADADTVYPRGWLSRIVNQFALHPEVAAVAGRFFYKDRLLLAGLEYTVRHIINRITSILLGRPMLPSGANFAFRRNLFLSLNGYRGLSYSPDQYGICTRMRKMGKVLYDKDLYCLTSARRLHKPAYLIAMDVIRHIAIWCAYFLQSRLSELRRLVVRMRLQKIASLWRVLAFGPMLLHGYLVPTSSACGKVYSKAVTTEKVAAITFDDGPNEPYTSEILDILARYNVKATFFTIGKNVERYPEVARSIVDKGHVIGNHSYTHNANHALTQYGSKDLRQAQQAIYNVTGVSPHLYRPPHGRKTPWQLKAVQKEGMITVTWSVSANDQHVFAFWGKPSPESFAKKIVSRTKPGAVILLHDGYSTYRNCAKADRSLTAKALPLIIRQLLVKGYRLVTVPQLLGVPAYNGAPASELK